MISFRGRLAFCSNFHPSPVLLYGILYPTAEHAYQAQKTLDPAKRRLISMLSRPGDAKMAGRQLEIRPDWNDVRVEVMRRIVFLKFANNPEVAALLAATADERLVEVNDWGDRFWGQCPEGVGQNWLGEILMEVRAHMRTFA